MKLMMIITINLSDFSGCISFTNEAFVYMMEADVPNGSLRDINISGCTQFNLGYIGFARASNCKTLVMRDLNKIDDFTATCIARGCKFLQNIDFSCCRYIHDSCFEYIFQGCTRYSYFIVILY